MRNPLRIFNSRYSECARTTQHSIRHRWLRYGLVILLSAFSANACAREVSIHVLCETWEGEPLAGVGVGVGDPLKDESARLTDQDGRATIRAEIPYYAESVLVRFGAKPADVSLDEWVSNAKELSQLWKKYYLPFAESHVKGIVVDLNPDEIEYQVVFTAMPAIVVTGVVVNAKDGRPIDEGMVRARHASSGLSRLHGSREFRLQGVARDRENTLYVGVFPPAVKYPQTILVDLDARQTSTNLNLGKIEVDDLLDRPSGLASIWLPGTGGAMLVSTDGELIFTYIVNPDGSLMTARYGEAAPAPLPTGEYYVIPQSFMVMTHQVKLIDAVRLGKDVSELDLPLLTVTQDETTELTLSSDRVEEINEALETYKLDEAGE